MLPSPEPTPGVPSDRLWNWFQSLTRSSGADTDGRYRIQSRQVYILPTGFGVLYAIMLLGMLFGSNNYGSNPGFLFTFLLAGLGLAGLFQTWKNLLGLQLVTVSAQPVFCGHPAQFKLTFRNTSTTPRPGISGYVWRRKGSQSNPVDLPAQQEGVVEILLPASRRGHLKAGRIAVTTRYPLGLFKSWAYIQIEEACLVYPTAAEVPGGVDYGDDTTKVKRSIKRDGDDFAGHKPYQDGDNVMHVDWKAVARGKGWNLKSFEQNQGEEIWLRWDATTGDSVEQRISALTRAVIDLETTGQTYGLALPDQSLQPGRGLAHRHLCLQALALFNVA